MHALAWGLVASRFGLWAFDLAVSQMLQERVPSEQLGEALLSSIMRVLLTPHPECPASGCGHLTWVSCKVHERVLIAQTGIALSCSSPFGLLTRLTYRCSGKGISMSSWILLLLLLCLCPLDICSLLQDCALISVLIEMYKQRTSISHYAHPLLTGLHTPIIVTGSYMRANPC